MDYLLQSLFLFILAAFVLGLIVGWQSCRHEPRLHGLGWMWGGLAAFVFGLFISAGKLIKGAAGLWFDNLMWLLGAYLLGCLLGCAIRQLLQPEAPSAAAISAADKLTLLGDAPAAAAAAPTVAPKATVPAAPVAAKPAAPPAPAAIRPYQWQAAKEGGAVTLTGYAPSEAIRGGIAAAAKAAVAPAAVIDKMQLGSGEPQGFRSMAEAALGHLGHLDRGIASLIDAKYTLTGVAASKSGYDAAMAGVKALPAGFALAKADIVAPPPAPEPKPSPEPKPAPAAAPKLESEESVPGKRPPGYAQPIGGKADDLKRIRGIGKQNEGRLHGLGIWHYDQIAKWTPEEALWVGSYLAFPGRIEREEWVMQAKVLAAGGETEFSRRVARGEVATSQDDGDAGQSNIRKIDPLRPPNGTPPKG